MVNPNAVAQKATLSLARAVEHHLPMMRWTGNIHFSSMFFAAMHSSREKVSLVINKEKVNVVTKHILRASNSAFILKTVSTFTFSRTVPRNTGIGRTSELRNCPTNSRLPSSRRCIPVRRANQRIDYVSSIDCTSKNRCKSWATRPMQKDSTFQLLAFFFRCIFLFDDRVRRQNTVMASRRNG